MTDISIITATCNSSDTIDQCIQSVNIQNVDVEHIFVDCVSTDNTLDIIKANSEARSIIISEPDKGFYDAINKGIGLATSDIVGILNSDDFYASNNVLAKVCDVFKDAQVEACYGDLNYIDDRERVIRKWRTGAHTPRDFYWGWMPPHPTFFVRRSVYDQFGLFNLDMGTAADYEIMLRLLLKHKIQSVHIPEVMVNMRVGGMSNVSFASRLRANRMDRKAWVVNQLKPYPWTLMMKPLRKIGQWFT